MRARSPCIRSVERKDEGNHTHLRSMVTKPKPIRPPPLPGIFGVPGSGSRIAWEPAPHKTRQKSGPAKAPAEQVVKDDPALDAAAIFGGREDQHRTRGRQANHLLQID